MRKAQMDTLMAAMLESHDSVSDLNFSVDRPLQVHSNGELAPVSVTPPIANLTPFQTETLALNLMHNDRRLIQMVLQQGSCDTSYFLTGKARFRVNVFSQRGNYSIVMRKLETLIPSIDDLKLPEAFRKMTKDKNGLVLVSGPTGVGKTTSLAALLRELNETRPIHIITWRTPSSSSIPTSRRLSTSVNWAPTS